MVPKNLLQQLVKYNNYIICLWDPGQLPPISKEEDNHSLDNPHNFLDEIIRHEVESEIIQLTKDIRAGKQLNNFQGKEVQILNKEDLTTGKLTWANQIICSKNSTRIKLNNLMRELLGKIRNP